MKSWLAAAAFAATLAAAPVLGQTREDVLGMLALHFGQSEPFVEAIDAIQAAVADDDAETLASWISYPFDVTIDGEDYRFEDAEGVVEHYGSMMTGEIEEAILEQKVEDLFVNAEGVMLGRGQMWLTGICTDETCENFDVRIIRIQSGDPGEPSR